MTQYPCSLSTADFAAYLAEHDVPLLDVRTAEEYAEGHLPQALNVDVLSADFLTQAQSALGDAPELALYCRSGQRSKIAMQQLTEAGFAVVELNEGILSWVAQGLRLSK